MSFQEQVQKTLDELVANGVELGVQVVAYRDGVKVVDAVAGLAAPNWVAGHSGHRLLQLLLGKGAMSTLMHQEVDRGAFRYDTPVVELWPEFGAHGGCFKSNKGARAEARNDRFFRLDSECRKK